MTDMTKETERDERIRRLLDQLGSELISRIIGNQSAITEGQVMTVGPPPYRRLDCDGRALAYIRSRPRKVSVRVDVSGLWVAPSSCTLQIPSASGIALLIQTYKDIEPAVAFLDQVVSTTRAIHARAA
ncbi:MAG: hypothetical protein KTR25_01310 [Myxococcales bacterium]|nr:hypothetical protein [Myxococcales bacterium]